MRHVSAEALLLGTVTLWSFNFAAVGYGVTHGFEPLTYAALRWGLAGVTLAGLALWRRHTLLIGWRDGAILSGAAVIGVLVNQISYVYAFRLVSASTVALVFGTLPIFVSLVSQLSGMERLRPRHWVATGVSFAGVALVALGASAGLSASIGGILLALVTTSTFALYSVAIVPVMRRRSPLVVTAVSALAGAVLLAAASSTVLAHQRWDEPGALAWGALVYSALFSLTLGNLFWLTAIKRVGPGRASLFANLQPFLGALFAVVILSESLSRPQIAGGCVIAVGILLGSRTRVKALLSE